MLIVRALNIPYGMTGIYFFLCYILKYVCHTYTCTRTCTVISQANPRFKIYVLYALAFTKVFAQEIAVHVHFFISFVFDTFVL